MHATGEEFAGKAQAVGDPKPGDLRVAWLKPSILGRRNVVPDVSLSSKPVAAGTALPPLSLILGGARSGKSRYAEQMIAAAGLPALYLATAEARDDEMRQRIAVHRARRGTQWTTFEEPVEIVNCLLAGTEGARPVLIDCLTLWLSNLMGAGADIGFEIERLLAVLPQLRFPVVMVANEVGLGIVPENAMARAFRDHAGRLNQGVAALAQRVVFMAAGLPLALKG
jgi:adenosylcobinamide kinase / adenosylcobinamide-phosphate guanylyltransferase